jgi:ABC-type sugar transport system ATPase subunit
MPDVSSGNSESATSSGTWPTGAILVDIANAAKSFGATRALRSATLEIRAGEVHAVVGENGSGKSTLVKLLAGVHQPDAGKLSVIGVDQPKWLPNPRAAQDAGIVTVFQEVLVVGPRSILENIWIGTDGLFAIRHSDSDKRERAGLILTELLGVCPPLDTPAEALSLSDRQACCIARALVRDPKVLILDESTSALDVATRDRLFEVVRRLCRAGSGIVFISHRMDEIDQLADRITVLRSGESVATLDAAESDSEVLVRHMTGEAQLTAGVEKVARARRVGEKVLLRAEAIELHPGSTPIDFELKAGELVGLAGLEGQGQDRFLHALRGVKAPAGRVFAGEQLDTPIDTPQHAFSAGIIYTPRDRRSESLLPSLSIAENFAVPTMRLDRRAGFFSWASAGRRLSEYIDRLRIRMPAASNPITVLSGGNQQKVIVARWLAASPRVLLLNDPTRGVDLNAKRDLYALLEELTSEGVAVVMLSTELDEHVELMDRVIVFHDNAVSASVSRDDLSRERLVSAFFSQAKEAKTDA